jgi:hypothetical protein
MISRASAALAAATLSVMLFVPSAGRAMPAAMMNEPPAPWTDAGAKPFVRRDAANHVTAMGMVIPAATVKALPAHRSEAVYPLEGAGLVRSANLQWHPAGHEPMHVYDVPHFDLHFYTIGEDVRHTIVPGAAAGTVKPAKAILPAGVILAPGFVPAMGMHAVPGTQPEFNGGKFTVSPIIGYWNGELAFFEVMFTKGWLVKNLDKEAPYPQPASIHQHGSYPTRYSVHYDKAADAYTVALTHFRSR